VVVGKIEAEKEEKRRRKFIKHINVKVNKAVKKMARLPEYLKCHLSWLPNMHFYRASRYASAVLGVVILSVGRSVCPSVRHMRTLRQNQRMHCIYFDSAQKGNHSSFLTPTVVGGKRSLPSEICAQSDPPHSKNTDFGRFSPITSQP